MQNQTVIGVDLGGTNMRAATVQDGHMGNIQMLPVPATGTNEAVLNQLFSLLDPIVSKQVYGIGLGVPGLIDHENQMVYDVVNIPVWKEVPLQQILEERYQLRVAINNDANCFALGEHRFGKGIGYSSIVGLTIGTGLGAGIIINGRLYDGGNCGAGEFGMVPYLDQYYEYYASGQFFSNIYHLDGEKVLSVQLVATPFL